MVEQLEYRLVLSTITDLGTLSGGVQSLATGINASGQVVGYSTYQGNDIEHAFLYSNGQMTDLGTLGGKHSYGEGINDAGQVVGMSNTSNGDEHAFLYGSSQMTDLGTLGGTYSWAWGINHSGQVVGVSNTSSGDLRAFLYSNGQMTDLGTLPGDTQSSARGINDSGQVVGSSQTMNGGAHAFLYSDGKMIDLGTLPGTTTSEANGINDAGQVIGDAQVSNDVQYAFLYSNGQMTNLGTLPGGTLSSARGINDAGQVVGVAHASNGDDHAFLYSNGHMIDLNTLLPQNSGWLLESAAAINDADQIVGTGIINGQTHAFLLNLGSSPTISASPSSQTVTAGANVSLTASASGTPVPTVQWQVSTDGGLSFTNINGATSTTLTLNDVTVDMNGDEYQAVFTNSVGSITTSAATLTVNAATSIPVVTLNPSSQSITAGFTVSFTASASGTPTPTVQWQVSTDGGKTFTNINGATSTTLTLTAGSTGAANGDEYEAVFTNSVGSSTTSAATLTVLKPPTVTTSPSNVTVTVGQNITLTATANGNPAPTVQWQVSTDGGQTFSKISGATSTTLTLSDIQASQNGDEYQAVFTNSVGSGASNVATLTVNSVPPPPPTQPSSPAPQPSSPVLNLPPLLAMVDSLLGGTVTMNSNGTETVTDSIFGIPLLSATFDSSGNLESVSMFGFDITFLFM